jgi:hypothetical protein
MYAACVLRGHLLVCCNQGIAVLGLWVLAYVCFCAFGALLHAEHHQCCAQGLIQGLLLLLL